MELLGSLGACKSRSVCVNSVLQQGAKNNLLASSPAHEGKETEEHLQQLFQSAAFSLSIALSLVCWSEA